MESYTRLSDGGRSPQPEPAFTPPFSSEYDQQQSLAARLHAWWARHVQRTPAKQYPVSGYLTLIPLSGKHAEAAAGAQAEASCHADSLDMPILQKRHACTVSVQMRDSSLGEQNYWLEAWYVQLSCVSSLVEAALRIAALLLQAK